MKSLQDALYNWLTIKVVSDERPEDTPAKDTMELFEEILKEEHGLQKIQVEKESDMYIIHFVKNEEEKVSRFPVDLIEVMLNQIKSEPEKYKNYSIES
jgi:hypothetical protein